MNNSPENQQYLSSTILKIIRENIDSEAIVAGGAPRNWDHERSANDIDLYFRCNLNTQYATKNLLLKLFENTGLDVEVKAHKNLSRYALSINIKHIIDLEINGVLFQFIVLADVTGNFMQKVVKAFDIGICRIAYTGSNTYRSPEYNKDVTNSTITLYTKYLTDAQLRHSINNHVGKLLDYYVDHRLKINTVD